MPRAVTGRGECSRSVMQSMMSSAATIFGALTSIRPDLNGESLCASLTHRRKARAKPSRSRIEVSLSACIASGVPACTVAPKESRRS